MHTCLSNCWIRSRYRRAGLAVVLFLHCALAAAAGIVTDEVSVTGTVQSTLTLKVEDLKAFPPDQMGSLSVTRRVGEKENVSTVRGVRLTAVLERAGLRSEGGNDWRHTVVMARD